MKRMVIFLTEKQVNKFKRRAERKGISFSEVIRRQLDKGSKYEKNQNTK